jgi:penicillin-binding protein 2
MGMHYGEENKGWLGWFLRGLLVVSLIFLLARLFELQIVKGDYYKNIADGNRIRKISITAPRGKILARGGELLIGASEIKKRLVIKPGGEIEKDLNISGDADEIIVSDWETYYPLGRAFFHAGGYVGEASENEVGKINPRCPEKGPIKLGQLIGRTGLEEEYECSLSGIDGEELIEVDAMGKLIRVLGRKNPVPGVDLKTSISFDLQKKLPEFMDDLPGAVVISDAKGQIVALYSSPSFDPNLFGKSQYQEVVANALLDKRLPLFDRAIGGLFHPGSVFKPVVVLAALSEEKITKNYTYTDPGVIKVNEYSYANWYFTQYGRTEGTINVVRALARSTDTFFYNLGELVGAERIAFWANKMGLGSLTKIDIPGEIAGLIPTPEWKKKTKNESWFLGNTYHMSIGQGDIAVTPLEINAMTNTLVNGKLCNLRIVNDGTDPKCVDLKLNSDYLQTIKEGMIDVCSSGGTGYTFFDFSPQVACKTGTAETSPDGEPHAWFTVYAPTDVPDIITTVLIEKGGEGSKVAGPIARKIFDYWFHTEK